MQTMKAAVTTNPVSLAGAIAAAVSKEGKAEIRAIGAGAVNQAVKAIAVARGQPVERIWFACRDLRRYPRMETSGPQFGSRWRHYED